MKCDAYSKSIVDLVLNTAVSNSQGSKMITRIPRGFLLCNIYLRKEGRGVLWYEFSKNDRIVVNESGWQGRETRKTNKIVAGKL